MEAVLVVLAAVSLSAVVPLLADTLPVLPLSAVGSLSAVGRRKCPVVAVGRRSADVASLVMPWSLHNQARKTPCRAYPRHSWK